MNNEETNDKKNVFEKYIRPCFVAIGAVGAVLMAISYIMLVRIILNGVNMEMGVQRAILFAAINVGMTFAIWFFLRIFGEDLGKYQPISRKTNEEYKDLLPKKVHKLHSITYYRIKSSSITFVIKCVLGFISILAVSTFFVNGMFPPVNPENYASEELYNIALTIRSKGISSIYTYVATNIISTFATGLLAIVRGYDDYLDKQVPLLKKKILEMKGENYGNNSGN